MIKNRLFVGLCLIFLTGDLAYTFYQHLQMPLDGDMAESVVPASFVNELAKDPFAFNVLIQKKQLSNPNRFFSHYAMKVYFRNIPRLLQIFLDPIESVYVSAAIIKTIIQVLIILVMAILITGMKNTRKLIICSTLLTPLFQSEGFNRYMGIIDQSVTYDFFYAMPLLIIAVIFFPYLQAKRNKSKFSLSIIFKILMVCFILMLAFSGPLIPGVVLIIILLYFINEIIRIYKVIPTSVKQKWTEWIRFEYLFLIYFALVCMYSLYIGTFNNSNISSITVSERYKELPAGLFYIFTGKLGWLLLFGACIVNSLIIFKTSSQNVKKLILNTIIWIGLFSIIYIILLPLGGYREYRMHVVRYDTFIPVTICFFYLYGLTSWVLISEKRRVGWKIYATFLTIITFVFTFADKADIGENSCEKTSLKRIAESQEQVIKIPETCNIVSWSLITNYHQSELNARLFKIWNITNREKLYYQSKE